MDPHGVVPLDRLLGSYLSEGRWRSASGRWPEEPPVGTVLRFERVLDGQTYTYVAIRVQVPARAQWYFTKVKSYPVTWPTLVRLIGDEAKCAIAVSWFEVPAVE